MGLNLLQHVFYTKQEWLYHPSIDFLKHKKIESFIDAGACTGEYSNILLYNIPTIKQAVLIEAIKENYDFISSHVKDNRAACILGALYESSDFIDIVLNEENVGGNSIFGDPQKGKKVTVQCIKLKEITNQTKIDFLKMDIEGAEWDIIDNSEVIKDIPYLNIEAHIKEPEEALEYLKKNLPDHLYIPFNAPYNFFFARKEVLSENEIKQLEIYQ